MYTHTSIRERNIAAAERSSRKDEKQGEEKRRGEKEKEKKKNQRPKNEKLKTTFFLLTRFAP